MTWNPIEARKVLDRSTTCKFIRSVKKISGFSFESTRELVLLEENISKVSIYVSVAPYHMPDVNVEDEYPPTSTKSGRHADIESVSRTLGFKHQAYRLHIKNEAALIIFLEWYKYA